MFPDFRAGRAKAFGILNVMHAVVKHGISLRDA